MYFMFVTLNKQTNFLVTKSYKYQHYHFSYFYTSLHSYDTRVGPHIQFVVNNWITYNIPFVFSSTLEGDAHIGRRWKCIPSRCIPWRHGNPCTQPLASGTHYNGLASHCDTLNLSFPTQRPLRGWKQFQAGRCLWPSFVSIHAQSHIDKNLICIL